MSCNQTICAAHQIGQIKAGKFQRSADVHDPGGLQYVVGNVPIFQKFVPSIAIEEGTLAAAADKHDGGRSGRGGVAHHGIEVNARGTEIGQHGVAQRIHANHRNNSRNGAQFREHGGGICRATAAKKL